MYRSHLNCKNPCLSQGYLYHNTQVLRRFKDISLGYQRLGMLVYSVPAPKHVVGELVIEIYNHS